LEVKLFSKIKSIAKDFVTIISSNVISLAGAVITTTAAILFVIFLGVAMINLNNYVGILGFLIVPGFFFLGLILIPAGFFIYRRKIGFANFRDVTPSTFMEKLRVSKPQGLLTIIFAFTLINIAILATAGYQTFHYMESNVFCGTLCHTVMTPEYTAYQDSSHSRVQCVTCHIGAGADWFVKSKLSGMRQVFAVMFNTYHKPIETPIRNLRPARETCEQCHWPEKFQGKNLKNIITYADDEKNSPAQTLLLMNVGSGRSGEASGIHWHVAKDSLVKYISDNDMREKMLWVELTAKDGTKKVWSRDGYEPTDKDKEKARKMDCIDCHNRATHTYISMEHALRDSLLMGRIDSSIPFIKREAAKALANPGKDKKAVIAQITKDLADYYKNTYPDIYKIKEKQISESIAEIVRIYSRNIHPDMNVTWNTYVNHIGHEETPGCFRCHSGELANEKSESISQDCDLCHSIIRMGEPPKEIKDLFASAQGK
jgi:nitrate/TMAO reductase-like tetraheme cytochrome c subunit